MFTSYQNWKGAINWHEFLLYIRNKKTIHDQLQLTTVESINQLLFMTPMKNILQMSSERYVVLGNYLYNVQMV